MSDNEDLLGEDLGDQSLADYNLGNEEEEQLLADDYENVGPQNVPTSISSGYRESLDMGPPDYPTHVMEYNQQPIEYQVMAEAECVVPNISVEVPNTPLPELPTYAPYEPPVFEEHAVPPAIPASPIESPQIVPTDMNAQLLNGDLGGPRERFVSERPPGVQRMPQVRDIPDSLDKVVIPRGGFGRGRTSWRNPQFMQRFSHQSHPYRRNNMQRGNFNQQQRPQFPAPPPRASPPRADYAGPAPPQRPAPPPDAPELSPERPMHTHDMQMFRPAMERPPFPPRFFRPHMEERPQFRPNFEPRFFRPNFPPRQFASPMREIVPNSSHIPQVTIRQAIPMPGPSVDKGLKDGREPEVRMLPVPLPANLPPGGLAGKKVLINPHFKGNFQPPVEGPVKDIDDAAERFIAEQRSALARAAVRKYARRSPQRYIENTTIEIENELAHPPRRNNDDDDDLLRRQEEFINANRAGLRRRMRSPSPARRSPSPRRSPERRPRPDAPRHTDEDSEYKRRVREQESLRERVLRAKEVRRRKNAVALHKQLQDKERETQDKEKAALLKPPPVEAAPPAAPAPPPAAPPPPAPAVQVQHSKADTTLGSPDALARPDRSDRSDKLDKARPELKPAKEVRDRSPVREEKVEVNSTCENLTPPHALVVKRESSERALTPPLPDKRTESDDDLDLILGDIDGILSDDDDSGRFKEKTNKKPDPPKSKPQVDLRSKLPPKSSSEHKKQQRQKIVFTEDREEGKSKKKEKSPPRRAVVTSSTVTEDAEPPVEVKKTKVKSKLDITVKSRQRITYEKEQAEKAKEEEKNKAAFSNRRVILQRKAPKEKSSVFSRIEAKSDPTKPNPGIFSRAVRTAIGSENTRIVIKKDEPQIQFESDSDIDEDSLLEDSGNIATVANLPHGMTDTRLKTLAGNEVQNLILDKEERSAKITFKTTVAAEHFKKKFNNKMVAASRLSVTLR